MNFNFFFRKKILKSTLVLLFSSSAFQEIKAQDFYTTTPPPTSLRPELRDLRATLLSGWRNPDYVFLALHRAAWIDGTPENSIPAVRNAISNGHIDIIEIDLKSSGDGKVFLMHDDYLQRTTNFLDLYPNINGTGKDNYGKTSHYSWSELSKLRLKNEEKTYTNEKIPLLKDIINIARAKGVILQLDINDDRTFELALRAVKISDAFSFVMFKGNKTPDELTPYINLLTLQELEQFIFAPIVKPDSKPSGSSVADPMGFYEQWEAWRKINPKFVGIAGIYELVLRNSSDTQLINIANIIRNKGKRYGVFSAQPEYYKGRYKGNVNINQCCADNPEIDRRGDFDFILAPGNYKNAGVNGYIITDEVTTFLEFFPNRTIN